MDERHYFICQLPQPATTVVEAHRILRPEAVRRDAVVRQGEYFFRELDLENRGRIDAMVRGGKWPVRRKISLGTLFGRREGNPHVADEVVVVPDLRAFEATGYMLPGNVYVRGLVRHVDHKTVRFSSWAEVFRNTEAVETRRDRVQWVD